MDDAVAVIASKIASESKNAIFSKSKIMIPQSDYCSEGASGTFKVFYFGRFTPP